MRKVIDYVLEYREGGEAGSVSLSIDFISNAMIKEYNEILQIVHQVRIDWYKFQEKLAVRKELQEDLEKNKDRIDFLEKEIVSLGDKLKSNGETDFFERRFRLIKKILLRNSIPETDKLMDFDFWDECVDPNVLIDFLDEVIWKDIDKKKGH